MRPQPVSIRALEVRGLGINEAMLLLRHLFVFDFSFILLVILLIEAKSVLMSG
jgi:hypothetical protein